MKRPVSWSLFGPRFKRDGSNPADLVVANADILTCDPVDSRCSALAVRDGEIVFVGDDGAVSEYVGADTRVVDARGRTLTPGFIDNHCHVLWIGGLMSLMTRRLFEASSLEELNQMVLEHARANADIPCVMGVGWRFEHMPGGVPTRQMLDSVVKDRPVLLMSLCGQCGWVNTCALELLEERNPSALERLSPGRDESGRLAGTLNHFHSFSPLDFFTEEEIDPVFQSVVPQAISEVLDEAVSVGVTTMDDVQLYRPFLPYLLEYRDAGFLDRVRLRGSFYVDSHDLADESRLKEDLEWWRRQGEKESDDRLVLGKSLKFYIDGTVGNRTAFLMEPYSDRPGCYGRPDWGPDEFNRVIELVDSMGFQSCTHAVGDAGIRRVLDACERALDINGERDARHRLEHCELPVAEDIERIAGMGVQAAMQPAHFFGDEVVEETLGPERLNRWMPWRSLEKAGVAVSFGSDWCNSPLNPIYGLLIATTRMNYKQESDWGPDQKISLESAIRHWTIDSAVALQMEDRIGSLEVGKRADFVLFNTSPLKINSWWFLLTNKMEIGEMDDFVDMTVVDGEIVYQK